eukprot:SAG31_NODE_159_length_21911_cov_12.220750_6_plen_163_part_00
MNFPSTTVAPAAEIRVSSTNAAVVSVHLEDFGSGLLGAHCAELGGRSPCSWREAVVGARALVEVDVQCGRSPANRCQLRLPSDRPSTLHARHLLLGASKASVANATTDGWLIVDDARSDVLLGSASSVDALAITNIKTTAGRAGGGGRLAVGVHSSGNVALA